MEIPKTNLQYNDLRIRLWSDNAIGFSGRLSPLLNLTTNLLQLNSTGLSLVPDKSTGFGYLLLEFVWLADDTLPNLLQFELTAHSSLGYLSNDGQKMMVRQKEGLWKSNSVQVIDEMGNKTLVLQSSSMFIDTLNMSYLKLQYNLSTDNKVIPSVLKFDLSIKNNANHSLFGAANLSLQTGCKEGCSVCFVEVPDSCTKCDLKFELANQTCVAIVPLATVLELVSTGYLMNRSHPLVLSIFGMAFILFSRIFVSRMYWNIWSTEVTTKVITGNLVVLVIIFRITSSVDQEKSMQPMWITFLSMNILLNSLLVFIFWHLAQHYPFLRPSSRSKVALHATYVGACLVSITNLFANVADVVILKRLEADKVKGGKESLEKGQQKQGQHRSSSSIGGSQEHKKRRSRSLDDEEGYPKDLFGQPYEAKEIELIKFSTPQLKIGPSGSQVDQDDTQLYLLDYLNILRYVNLGIKSALLLCTTVLSFFSGYEPWTYAPLEVIILLCIEIFFSARYSIEHSEEQLWRKNYEKKIMLRINKINAASNEASNSSESDNTNTPLQPQANNVNSEGRHEVDIKLELPSSDNFSRKSQQNPETPAASFLKINGSRVNWEGIINSMVDKHDRLVEDDELSYDTDTIIEKTEQKFKEFMQKANAESGSKSRGSLARSNSAEPSRRNSQLNKMLPMKFVIEGLTRHHDPGLRLDFDDSSEESAGEKEADDSDFKFLAEAAGFDPAMFESGWENQSSSNVQNAFRFQDEDVD